MPVAVHWKEAAGFIVPVLWQVTLGQTPQTSTPEPGNRAALPRLCGPAEGKCWIRICTSDSLCSGLMPLLGNGLCAPTGLVPTQASPCTACGQPMGLFPSL